MKQQKRPSIMKTPIFWGALVGAAVLISFLVLRTVENTEFAGVPKRAVEYYKQGSQYLDNGEVEKALNVLLKASELDQSFAPALGRIAEAYFRAAQAHKINKNNQMMTAMLEQSKVYCDRALEADPANGFGHMVIGLLHFENGNLDSALIEMKLADEAKVNTFEFHSMLGYLYNQESETTKCIEQYQKALELKPTDTKTLTNLAELYFAVGSYDKAAQYYGDLMKYDEKNDQVRASYAASLWKDGKEEQAKRLLNDILESPQGNKFHKYNGVAWVLIDKDIDIDWGLKLAKAAYDMKPKNIESVDILGWGYYKAGDYANAVSFLNMSMRMKPSDEVKRRLDMAKEKLDASK